MESEGRSPLRILRHALRISDVFTGILVFRVESLVSYVGPSLNGRVGEPNGYRKCIVVPAVRANRIKPVDLVLIRFADDTMPVRGDRYCKRSVRVVRVKLCGSLRRL